MTWILVKAPNREFADDLEYVYHGEIKCANMRPVGLTKKEGEVEVRFYMSSLDAKRLNKKESR